MKKLRLGGIVAGIALVMMIGCTAEKNEISEKGIKDSITIAYQYGLGYAPVYIVQEQQLIEKAYRESMGRDLEITWTLMNSGADINAGVSSGNIQVGILGIAPAITGIQNGIQYKVFASISGLPQGMVTNVPEINSLGDYIGSENQIAVVNIGSIQHIMLAKALQESGYDPHALDANIVAMKNPDGMAAVINGTVSGHVTSSQYILQERQEESLHELPELADSWSAEKTYIIGVASTVMKEENPKLYEAVCQAFTEADEYINVNTEEAAEICAKYDGTNAALEYEYMKQGTYDTATAGLMEMAQFMYGAGFIETCPENYSDLVFENVKGN